MILAIFFISQWTKSFRLYSIFFFIKLFLWLNYGLVWFIVKYLASVEPSNECGFNLEAVEGVQSEGPSIQIKRHPPERTAVWAFVSESSQFPWPSLVTNTGVRVSREEEEGCGQPRRDLNSTRGGAGRAKP